jgi:hypothetical protein
MSDQKPLREEEVVINVPKGSAAHVRIEEVEHDDLNAEVVVRVSKRRKSTHLPVLGVITK